MIVIPALAVRNGVAVRPPRSPAEDEDASLGSPASVARMWASAGFRRLHVVDLDGASGSSASSRVVEDVLRDGALDAQVMAGADSTDSIERFLDAGAGRVILGPRGLEERDWLAKVSGVFPGLLVIATDLRERRVVTRGWVRTLPLDILDVVDELSGLPLAGLLVSTVPSGADQESVGLALIEDIVEACEFPVMTIGTPGTMGELRALEHRGVAGVVLGQSLYDGTLDARAVAQEFSE